MKNNLFGKATALVMGSLVIFSGQALTFSSNNQELDNADALGESELLIAQNGELSEEDYEVVSQLLLEAETIFGNFQAGVAESDLPGKNVLVVELVNVKTVIGDLRLRVDNQSLTRGDLIAVAEQLFDLSTTLSDTCAQLETTARRSEEGKAVARSCVRATTFLGDLALEIKSRALAAGN